MKLYIAGPMTGIPDYNRAAFHEAAQRLTAAGYDCYNPATFLGSDDWHTCLRVGVAALCGCDGVALLDGWEDSRGVKLELHVARALEMRIAEMWRWE